MQRWHLRRERERITSASSAALKAGGGDGRWPPHPGQHPEPFVQSAAPPSAHAHWCAP